ncbi:hypothetical protein ISG33_08000 [Glaciecola sp. MH2013]|uniref:hypothetical protein n=1 Tax=Glaciecola sp. MH2013 TaxID=2785524 RepID=UPI00189D5DC3|nr:hypothetical protein [Glaciecola sp. MH2013]MBF7073335.1 hypothetical protein [Glaciecola sp. MH2013]
MPQQALSAPPLALVKTWVELLKDDNRDVASHARDMLERAFEQQVDLVLYCKKHNIKMS